MTSNKNNFLTALFIFFTSVLITNAQDTEVLFTIEEVPAYKNEFIYVYSKNSSNNEAAFTKKDIEEYLELYKKFKLKIYHAGVLGYDTLPELIDEFKTYEKQLKKPYLTDDKVKQKLINEAYQRYLTEVNASHILILVKEDDSPEDTLKAWNKIISLRERALSGEPFDRLAKEFSEDPSAKSNGGNLGYFTSMQMVYPFETAAYNTAVGDISEPVRTQFGYHIIKVKDKRPSSGKVKISHLLIKKNPADSSNNARNKIFEIYDRIKAGLGWGEAIRMFSEDQATKSVEGLINREFSSSQLPPGFSEAAFSLESKGDISDPVQSQFGWHLIRLEEKVPVETFEVMETQIRRRISTDKRSELEKRALIEKLKTENNFLMNSQNKDFLAQSWKKDLSEEEGNKIIFSIGSQSWRIRDFLAFVTRVKGEDRFEILFSQFEEEAIIQFEEDHLSDKYPEYRYLRNEYWEGILLFKLMEEKVWDKAAKDSLGLVNYYSNHKENYKWKKRINTTLFISDKQSSLNKIKNQLLEGVASDSLVSNFKNNTSVNVLSGVFEKGDSELPSKIPWEKGIHSFEDNNIYYLADVKNILEASTKKISECMGLVIADYQDKLDKELVEKLEDTYKLKINKKVLKGVYEELVQ